MSELQPVADVHVDGEAGKGCLQSVLECSGEWCVLLPVQHKVLWLRAISCRRRWVARLNKKIERLVDALAITERLKDISLHENARLCWICQRQSALHPAAYFNFLIYQVRGLADGLKANAPYYDAGETDRSGSIHHRNIEFDIERARKVLIPIEALVCRAAVNLDFVIAHVMALPRTGSMPLGKPVSCW